MRNRLLLLPLAVAALLPMAAGCSGAGSRGNAAAAVAVQLLRDAHDGDGGAACALLAPDTAAEVAKSAGKACPDAITGADLPDPGGVTTVTVDGQWARVALTARDGDGTLFLAMFPGGWRVVAAGCTSRGERPYDCAVQGG